MLLLDGGILLGTYFGVRVIEKYRKKSRKKPRKKDIQKKSIYSHKIVAVDGFR